MRTHVSIHFFSRIWSVSWVRRDILEVTMSRAVSSTMLGKPAARRSEAYRSGGVHHVKQCQDPTSVHTMQNFCSTRNCLVSSRENCPRRSSLTNHFLHVLTVASSGGMRGRHCEPWTNNAFVLFFDVSTSCKDDDAMGTSVK